MYPKKVFIKRKIQIYAVHHDFNFYLKNKTINFFHI